jgi:hypothetical protein
MSMPLEPQSPQAQWDVDKVQTEQHRHLNSLYIAYKHALAPKRQAHARATESTSAALVAVGRMLAVPGAIPGVRPACSAAERCGGASGTAACHTPSSGAPRTPKM